MKTFIFAAIALVSLSGCCATVRTVPAYGGYGYVQSAPVYYGTPAYRASPRGYHYRGYERVR
jgi:hypothetical protein